MVQWTNDIETISKGYMFETFVSKIASKISVPLKQIFVETCF